MSSYIPFLKSKSNEIIAIGKLDGETQEAITPFFDIPKKPSGYSESKFKSTISTTATAIERHIGKSKEFYIDNYDVENDLSINGKNSYKHILESFSSFSVIPTISIDRTEGHLESVIEAKDEGLINSSVVAFRVTPEDFESYDVVEDDIIDMLDPAFDKFIQIDLIIDCRLCSNLDANTIATNASNFVRSFSGNYDLRHLIITGSSIPPSIGDVLPVGTERVLNRNEIEIFRLTNRQLEGFHPIFGDYTTVSPNYSDVSVAPEIMSSMITAKLTYSYEDKHYFARGRGLRTNGYEQYFGLAAKICSTGYFRGASYSTGDAYFHEKSQSRGNNGAPSAVIGPSVNAHATFMARQIALGQLI